MPGTVRRHKEKCPTKRLIGRLRLQKTVRWRNAGIKKNVLAEMPAKCRELPGRKKLSSPKCQRNAGNCRDQKKCRRRNAGKDRADIPARCHSRKRLCRNAGNCQDRKIVLAEMLAQCRELLAQCLKVFLSCHRVSGSCLHRAGTVRESS